MSHAMAGNSGVQRWRAALSFRPPYLIGRTIVATLRLNLGRGGLRQHLNFLRHAAAFVLRPTAVNYVHTILQIEPSLTCNLNCDHCTHQAHTSHQNLTLDNLKRIVARFPYLTQINLTGVGEPLLNREIFPIIDFIKGKKIFLRMTTNGMLLREPVARQLIASGIDELKISIDAIDDTLARTLRKGSNMELIQGNIKTLNALKRELGSKTPLLEINTVLSVQNIHELPRIVRAAADLQAQSIYVYHLLDLFDSPAVKALQLYAGDNATKARNAVAEARALAKEFGIALRLPGMTPRPSPCNLPWTLMIVAANGDVYPCCIYHFKRAESATGDVIFGNILETPLAEVVNSRNAVRLRRALKTKDYTNTCRNCPVTMGTF